ncbi:MAG TPA: sulfurtransferase [Thermoleophilaceae bacterium]|nr:sulfurtransferase [Thermoleophilaceae bacterium]
MPFGPLVDAAWLRAEISAPDLAVVDCRWRIGEPGAGEALWAAGHIPGAGFLDVDGDLSAPPGPGGRHPLPDPDEFARAATRAGIAAGSRVVAYDDPSIGGAARLWWILRHLGHDSVAVLDGGIDAWLAKGGMLERCDGPAPGSPPFSPGPALDDAVEAGGVPPAHGALVDARSPERFRGDAEPLDPVAGHIPGAVNVPYTDLAPGGRYRSPAEIRARLAEAGADGGLTAYCGSGISACVVLLAAEHAGVSGRLYPGSWSDWSARGLPAETGG